MPDSTTSGKDKISRKGILSIAVLLVLIGVNAIWLVVSRNSGPLIALIFYLVITFLCFRRRHFQAGVIAGVLGFGVHLGELLVQGARELTGIDQVFFYANLILPLPLLITSYLASRVKSGTQAEMR